MKTRLFYAIGLVAAAVLLFSVVPAAKKPTYNVVTVTNGGTISGRVLWEGPAADVPAMVINKNVEICDRHATKLRNIITH